MKYVSRTLAIVSVVAVVAALMPSADAACTAAKQFVSGSKDARYLYNYVYFATGSPNGGANHVGHFWQPSDPANNNEGGYDVSEWLRIFVNWYLDGNLTRGAVTGCPTGELAILAMDKSADDTEASFILWYSAEYVSCPVQFDFSPISDECADRSTTFGAFNSAPIPRPQVTGSSRNGNLVTMDLSFADIAAGFYDGGVGASPYTYVPNLVLYTQTLPKASPAPGRDIADWVSSGTTADTSAPTVAGFSVDCTDPGTYVYVAAALEFQNGISEYVGAHTVVECDPNLADPGDKFDLIRDKGKGQKKGKPFQQN